MRGIGRPRNWNDWLALIIIVGVPGLWLTHMLNDLLIGVTGTGWTLVLQYYFRRAPDPTQQGDG